MVSFVKENDEQNKKKTKVSTLTSWSLGTVGYVKSGNGVVERDENGLVAFLGYSLVVELLIGDL